MQKLRATELLGRQLNSVEQKYSPEELYVEGTLEIPLPGPRVSIVGTRNASRAGIDLAERIVRELVRRNVVIVSGLAKGIDTVAHLSAMRAGGRTVAVLGTPLDRYYPAQNRDLQMTIQREHLAISQFPIGHVTKPRDFIIRNRTMALISHASVIVEAGETSGALSQGWETLRLGRPLFISRMLVGNEDLNWPSKLMEYGAMVLEDDDGEIVDHLPSRDSATIELVL